MYELTTCPHQWMQAGDFDAELVLATLMESQAGVEPPQLPPQNQNTSSYQPASAGRFSFANMPSSSRPPPRQKEPPRQKRATGPPRETTATGSSQPTHEAPSPIPHAPQNMSQHSNMDTTPPPSSDEDEEFVASTPPHRRVS